MLGCTQVRCGAKDLFLTYGMFQTSTSVHRPFLRVVITPTVLALHDLLNYVHTAEQTASQSKSVASVVHSVGKSMSFYQQDKMS